MKKKYLYLLLVSPLFVAAFLRTPTATSIPTTCYDVDFIFARGSGSSLNAADYQAFSSAIPAYLTNSTITYHFYELGTSAHGGATYRAAAVGTENFGNFTTALGAVVSGGTSYNYGSSVASGVKELSVYVDEVLAKCPNTKFVVAGYSQGAQVISSALPELNPANIIYAATFGDPKLYLPEGQGIKPVACSGKNLSPYRTYVPDCYAYEGILGGKKPYQPTMYTNGQIGTWCIYHDIMCSAYIKLSDPISSHLNYTTDGMYQSAARVISNKIQAAYPEKFLYTNFYSGYDVIFMFDTTRSMLPNIQKYRDYAVELARRVVNGGGRVSLYEYRDLIDTDGAHTDDCYLGRCTIYDFQDIVKGLVADNGGDDPESLLSALKQAMTESNWQSGAKKAIVVLTDNTYHDPDLDGTTFSEVVSLSKTIDPVNVYVVSRNQLRDYYAAITSETGGSFFSIETELSSTPDIISQNLTLPVIAEEPTKISDLTLESLSSSSVKISFNTDADRVYIALNDAILGYTEETSLTITDLDSKIDNEIVLIPYSSTGFKGESKSATIKFISSNPNESQKEEPAQNEPIDIPLKIKVPNTGYF